MAYGAPSSRRRLFFKGSVGCPEILDTGDCGMEALDKRHTGKVIAGQVGGKGGVRSKVIVRG